MVCGRYRWLGTTFLCVVLLRVAGFYLSLLGTHLSHQLALKPTTKTSFLSFENLKKSSSVPLVEHLRSLRRKRLCLH